MWIFFAGAIFLPYFAVVLANAQGPGRAKGQSGAIAPKLSVKASDVKLSDDS